MAPEMSAPPQIKPQKLADYLEVMSKAIFQTGISWKVVENKWPELRGVMLGFEPALLAELSPEKLDEIASDKRVIRNRRKIEAIIGNGLRMMELDEKHGGFANYLRSHDNFERLIKDLRKNFKFLGDMGCYYFLYVVGEKVPDYHEWCASRTK